jgi:hypothetical protein
METEQVSLTLGLSRTFNWPVIDRLLELNVMSFCVIDVNVPLIWSAPVNVNEYDAAETPQFIRVNVNCVPSTPLLAVLAEPATATVPPRGQEAVLFTLPAGVPATIWL